MNIYMVNSGYDGCCYVRILLPAFHNGFLTDKKTRKSERADYSQIKADLMDADVVVFHRPEERAYHNLAEMLKNDGKKIVMDNDDTFKLDDYHPLADFTYDGLESKVKERGNAVDDFIKLSDLVTTSTEFLAKEYRQLNDNVVVLPNCVDPMDWDEPLKNETGKVRVGIVGSAALAYDYEHIKDILVYLSDREDVELVMFGLGNMEHRLKNPKVTKAFSPEYNFWDTLNYDHFPWVPNWKYQDTLNEARLDFCIIPRKDNYFNRCKSNIKVLEMAMLEIPCIAQSFPDGPYEEFKHGDNILKVKENKDWLMAIEEMINCRALRESMGKSIKEYVIDKYNIENNAHLWAKTYEKIKN